MVFKNHVLFSHFELSFIFYFFLGKKCNFITFRKYKITSYIYAFCIIVIFIQIIQHVGIYMDFA